MADVLICPRRPTSSVHVRWSREPFLEGEEGKIVINNPISQRRHLESDMATGRMNQMLQTRRETEFVYCES